jgi:hypothetical protein
MSTLYHIGIVKAVVAMGTANFPELTDKVFIVNAPWAAVKGWNLISPMLPPVRKRDFFWCVLSLCLSRACLGKVIVHMYK